MAKGPNPITLVAAVIAVAAIGLSVFMFLQVTNMKKSLGELNGDIPKGLENGEEGAGGHGEGDGSGALSAAYFEELANVNYKLGEFTANTADGKYAVMDLTLVIESSFYRADHEHFQTMQENYNNDLEYYNLYLQGGLDEKGEPKEEKGDHASRRPKAVLAAHTAGPSWTPPTEPVQPIRPMTALEHELAKHDSKVRDEVINQVNSHNAKDIIGPKGKPLFKQSLIDGINSVLGDDFGEVVDLYFNQLIAN